MITNHTPKSTLLMMVSAFCGHDLMKRAYEEAKEEYKFYSYGDAMLII
jgi:S-adenosylmethionine:tRNA ribosyltransferase-isomerase